jgi:copper chaperone NosL
MISRRSFLIGFVSLGAAAAAGAAAYFALPEGDEERAGPPAIRFGADTCAHCGMVIADRRFAAAWRGPGGAQRFDDIGCLVLLLRRQPDPAAVRAWVSDFRAESLVPAETAGYVADAQVNTPMAYRLVAAASLDAAHDLARELGGHVLDWRALIDSWSPEGTR